MRKLWVKVWITLDGVFDADTMDPKPYFIGSYQNLFDNELVHTQQQLA